MYKLLEKFTNCTATLEDIESMKELSATMAQASFCGLGQSSSTALASALKNRPEIFTSRIECCSIGNDYEKGMRI